MPLDHNSPVIRAIWKNKIFNIWKPIEKIELINPYIFNFSEKGKTMWTSKWSQHYRNYTGKHPRPVLSLLKGLIRRKNKNSQGHQWKNQIKQSSDGEQSLQIDIMHRDHAKREFLVKKALGQNRSRMLTCVITVMLRSLIYLFTDNVFRFSFELL